MIYVDMKYEVKHKVIEEISERISLLNCINLKLLKSN